MNPDAFDFVIVGAGAAGCVCAEKLSRKFSCLLLEAGGCRVRGGVSGLRVIDASVIPELPSGNTQAPTMAVADIASDLVLEDHAG